MQLCAASVQHFQNTKELELLKPNKPKTYFETLLPSGRHACRNLALRYGRDAGDSLLVSLIYFIHTPGMHNYT